MRRDALVDDLQQTRIPVLVLDTTAQLAFSWGLAADHGRLRRLQRAVPRVPGLAFHALELGQLFAAGQVEVAQRRVAPLLRDLLQVRRDGRLGDRQMARDLGLRPALQVQLGHLLPPLGDLQLLTLSRHRFGSKERGPTQRRTPGALRRRFLEPLGRWAASHRDPDGVCRQASRPVNRCQRSTITSQ